MDPISYGRVTGAIFAVVSVLQLLRALAGWPVIVGNTPIPIWASWVACVVADLLAGLGLTVHP